MAFLVQGTRLENGKLIMTVEGSETHEIKELSVEEYTFLKDNGMEFIDKVLWGTLYYPDWSDIGISGQGFVFIPKIICIDIECPNNEIQEKELKSAIESLKIHTMRKADKYTITVDKSKSIEYLIKLFSEICTQVGCKGKLRLSNVFPKSGLFDMIDTVVDNTVITDSSISIIDSDWLYNNVDFMRSYNVDGKDTVEKFIIGCLSYNADFYRYLDEVVRKFDNIERIGGMYKDDFLYMKYPGFLKNTKVIFSPEGLCELYFKVAKNWVPTNLKITDKYFSEFKYENILRVMNNGAVHYIPESIYVALMHKYVTVYDNANGVIKFATDKTEYEMDESQFLFLMSGVKWLYE